jgi:hypothetical protein
MQIYPMPIVKNSDVEKMLDEMLEGINLVTTKYRLEQDGYEIWCKYGTEVEDYNPRLLGSWRFIEDDNCEQIYFDIEVNGIWYAGHYYFVCYDEVIAMLLEAAGEIK